MLRWSILFVLRSTHPAAASNIPRRGGFIVSSTALWYHTWIGPTEICFVGRIDCNTQLQEESDIQRLASGLVVLWVNIPAGGAPQNKLGHMVPPKSQKIMCLLYPRSSKRRFKKTSYNRKTGDMEGGERWGRSDEARRDTGRWRARRDKSKKGWQRRNTKNIEIERTASYCRCGRNSNKKGCSRVQKTRQQCCRSRHRV